MYSTVRVGEAPASGQNALDRRTDLPKFFLDALVATIDVVDPVNKRIAVGGETREDEARRSPKIRGHDRRCRQSIHAPDDRGIAFKLDIRAHALQLQYVLEAILEYRFCHRADAVGAH